MHLLRAFLFLTFCLLAIWSKAQPPGYYDSAEGLTGEELRQALSLIIDEHQSQSYGSLWNHFQLTDKKSNGTVWDMYSDTPGTFPPYVFNFVSDQCGSYAQEGDCYNREHSVPSSWFNNAAPAYTDLFHLYPTDGYVNGMRSDHPYGLVNNPTFTAQNGGKRGPCAYPGYSGTAFEPIDEYKGDFARTYFYMATRYKSSLTAWDSPMFSGDNLSSWAAEMLLIWAANDPVDDKETDRNEAIFLIQNNRNPFIDRPEFADEVWGIEESVAIPELTNEPDNEKLAYIFSGFIYHPSMSQTAVISFRDSVGRLLAKISCGDGKTPLPPMDINGLIIIYISGPNGNSALKWVSQ